MSYDGNVTTITDEAGKVRQQTADGLGRLSAVIEDPYGVPYTTSYTYDVGNNLTGVNQSGQTRTFIYDSLSRLYQATNPENGTITYTYDAAGNLRTKKDANNKTTTMTYDQLNLVTGKSYSDSTPSVIYCYGGFTDPNCGNAPTGSWMNGRLTMVSSSASTAKYTAYNEFGDVTGSQQMTGVATYPFSYAYNKLSEQTSMTYPSGRVVRTSYDNRGRPLCVWAGSATACPSTATAAYASGITYAANSRINSLTMGNNLAETTMFNMRLQPTQIQVGSLLTLGFAYGGGTNGTTSDNGNVLSQTIAASGQPTLGQGYTYDGVNRLLTFGETTGTANQNYGYDQFGNRWISSGWIPYPGQTPTTGSSFPNNQWAAGSGVSYDPTGNQTGITSANRTFTYDAENRQANATVNGVATSYVYDGDGRRVIKTVSGGPSTVFVYDASGRLAAEYGGPANPLSGTTYLTADHLGSTRMVTNASGSVVSRFDYAPFGEELTAGLDGRVAPYSTNQYPTATLDGTSDKFTSKERDAETGLDFFGARYFSSAQGRFTSPDLKQFSSRTLLNPQKWNKYAYTLNGPLANIDPDGREEVTVTFRAFIPYANVAGFRGDNRTFSPDPRASSRVAVTVRIETDPSKNGGHPQLGSAQTVILPTHNNITGGEKTASGPLLPQVNTTQDANGNVTINVKENVRNPYQYLGSGIQSNVNMTVNQDATQASINGTVSGSPSFEANFTVDGGQTRNVPLQTAPDGSNDFTRALNFGVGLQETRPVDQTVTLPERKRDEQ